MKAVVVLALLLTGAVQDGVTTGTARSRPLTGDASVVARYELPAEPFPWTLTPNSAQDRIYLLTYPSAVQGPSEANNTVTCRVWFPKDDAPGRRPAVLLLHYLRGSFRPMEEAARYFASKGFVAMLLYMPHYGPRAGKDRGDARQMISDDVEATIGNFRQAVLDIRRAGDWLRSRKDVDPGRVGLFGVSLGSMVGSLAAGVDPRFTRSVFVVGGGDLPAIVLNESRETREMRQRLIDAGWNAEKLAATLEPIEPIGVAGRVDPHGVLLINATSDQVVPRACTERLAAAMGGPRLRWIKADHYTIALALPDILKEAAEHLKTRPDA